MRPSHCSTIYRISDYVVTTVNQNAHLAEYMILADEGYSLTSETPVVHKVFAIAAIDISFYFPPTLSLRTLKQQSTNSHPIT